MRDGDVSIKIKFEDVTQGDTKIPNHAFQSSRKAIKTQVSAAIAEYNELIGCGRWDGEVEKPEQNGAILIDGCPLAVHLCEGFVLDRDVDSTCAIHHELLVDLPRRLEELNWMEMSSFFEDALRLWPVR
jgi:hypothetical protein